MFTTRTTFMNRRLGALYRVPVAPDAVEGWTRYTFPDTQPRAGVLTLAAFLMLDPTHEARSSPTIRGRTVRELFLCQRVPDPPPNVDFSVVQNTDNAELRTARERVGVHLTAQACASCHRLTDPIGLGLENYDAIGAYRTLENGSPIDSSGEFDGNHYGNAVELGQRIAQSPTAANCVVRRGFEYGVGRPAAPGETPYLRYVSEGFASNNYSFPSLMRRIATSRAFTAVSNADVAASAPTTTQN
jgi:hypothetical protein